LEKAETSEKTSDCDSTQTASSAVSAVDTGENEEAEETPDIANELAALEGMKVCMNHRMQWIKFLKIFGLNVPSMNAKLGCSNCVSLGSLCNDFDFLSVLGTS